VRDLTLLVMLASLLLRLDQAWVGLDASLCLYRLDLLGRWSRLTRSNTDVILRVTRSSIDVILRVTRSNIDLILGRCHWLAWGYINLVLWNGLSSRNIDLVLLNRLRILLESQLPGQRIVRVVMRFKHGRLRRRSTVGGIHSPCKLRNGVVLVLRCYGRRLSVSPAEVDELGRIGYLLARP
jgi:hypothetical protein